LVSGGDERLGNQWGKHSNMERPNKIKKELLITKVDIQMKQNLVKVKNAINFDSNLDISTAKLVRIAIARLIKDFKNNRGIQFNVEENIK